MHLGEMIEGCNYSQPFDIFTVEEILFEKNPSHKISSGFRLFIPKKWHNVATLQNCERHETQGFVAVDHKHGIALNLRYFERKFRQESRGNRERRWKRLQAWERKMQPVDSLCNTHQIRNEQTDNEGRKTIPWEEMSVL